VVKKSYADFFCCPAGFATGTRKAVWQWAQRTIFPRVSSGTLTIFRQLMFGHMHVAAMSFVIGTTAREA
jgi:hypothetical protein